jgi:hypothetical protein
MSERVGGGRRFLPSGIPGHQLARDDIQRRPGAGRGSEARSVRGLPAQPLLPLHSPDGHPATLCEFRQHVAPIRRATLQRLLGDIARSRFHGRHLERPLVAHSGRANVRTDFSSPAAGPSRGRVVAVLLCDRIYQKDRRVHRGCPPACAGLNAKGSKPAWMSSGATEAPPGACLSPAFRGRPGLQPGRDRGHIKSAMCPVAEKSDARSQLPV